MNSSGTITAIIADDEPLLIDALQHELSIAWPELNVIATACNGADAISAVFEHGPDVVFLDIQMPAANGLEVAQTIAEDWPSNDGLSNPPLIVFATAFNDFAIKAFEAAAVDYLVKPITPKRLQSTVRRLKMLLTTAQAISADKFAFQMHRLISQDLLAKSTTYTPAKLQRIQAGSGDQIRIIPIDEVILFESADKYTSVYTAKNESLIREPLKSLLPQLDSSKFERIHRGAIVNMSMIESAHRDEAGKISLRLKGIEKVAIVSRVYRHLFQAM